MSEHFDPPMNPFPDAGKSSRRKGNGKDPKADVELLERFFDARICELLFHHAEKLNEGTNGVIFSFRIDDVPEELKVQLAERGIELGTEAAVKIMKVYVHGKDKKEFLLQQEAFRILSEGTHPVPVAGVPRPILYRDIEIADELQEKLKLAGVRSSSNRIELIVMDLIQGEDLAMIMYKEVLRKHPRAVHLAAEIDSMTFQDLQDEVASVLHFASPGGKARDEAQRQFEEIKVMDMNAEKLYSFLDRSGFVLPENILDQLENALKILHEHGLYHRDAHHRNFFIQGDISGKKTEGQEQPRAFIIDFGASVQVSENVDELAVYSQYEELESPAQRYVDDFALVRLLRKRLSGTRESPDQIEVNAFKKEIESWKKKLVRHEKFNELLENSVTRIRGGVFNARAVYARCPAPKPETFSVLSMVLLERGVLTAESARSEITALVKELSPAEEKKLRFLVGEL